MAELASVGFRRCRSPARRRLIISQTRSPASDASRRRWLSASSSGKTLPMSEALRAIHTHRWDFWLARASIAFIALLQLLMVNRLGIGPRWLAPTVELALLIPLSGVTAWTQISVRDAKEDRHWRLVARQRRWIRNSALFLTALISVVNLASLIMLLHALLGHSEHKSGQTLLLDAVNIWLTNVIVFALWFWNIDRGGPASRGVREPDKCDFLF